MDNVQICDSYIMIIITLYTYQSGDFSGEWLVTVSTSAKDKEPHKTESYE
jgi:hypothetical protein